MDFPFSQYLFWDSNIADVDLEKNKRYIIERVLTRGQLADFKALLKFYSHDEITEAILKSKELDAKTATFAVGILKYP